MATWATTATACQAVDAGAGWVGLPTATAAVATRCALTRKLVGHQRVDVTRQFVATGATVIATVIVAIIALVETIGRGAIQTSVGAILAITTWALRGTSPT